ncbi:Holliday junction branch migration protein RuvA [Candidatus Woesebacteria bacterium]|nr:Holliday junction branch migration protein RuvA [Candidatus Woesebacteria bacterium]
MISYLIGKPIVHLDELIILVGGVGYGVKVTNQALSDASNKEEIALHIYTHVKEDALSLFGFTSLDDKELFKLLISVSGVGPSTAMSILNKGSQKIIAAIQNADVSFFTSVKRVGKKAGQKIIIDLKNKLGGLKDLDLTPLSKNQSEIMEAVMSLGFAEDQINHAIKNLDFTNMTLEKSVQITIKELGKNR